MSDIFILVKRNASILPMQSRTWSVGEKMHVASGDYSANAYKAAGWLWECTTGGTSTGTPTWPSSATQDVTTVTQNGVVWTARMPGHSSGSTLSWDFAAPHETMAQGWVLYSGYAALGVGDRLIICIDKNFTPLASYTGSLQASMRTTDFGYSIIMSVDSSAGTPPMAVSAGATLTSGFYAARMYGITGSGGIGAGLAVGCTLLLASGYTQLDAILMNSVIDATNATANSTISGSGAIFDCTFTQGAAALDCLFAAGGVTYIDGLDLSGMNTSTDIFRQEPYEVGSSTLVSVRNIRLPSGYVGNLHLVKGSSSAWGRLNDKSSELTFSVMEQVAVGTTKGVTTITPSGDRVTSESSIYRSGGATENGAPASRKVVIAGVVKRPQLLLRLVRPYPLAAEDSAWSAGAAKTVTVHLIHDSATNLKDGDLWMRVRVLDDASYLMSSTVTTEVANLLNDTPTDLASSTATWVGTGGFSNANKQKMSVSVNPRLKGLIVIDICTLIGSSKTLYICPKVDVS